jgi:hypothetical protein
METTTMLTDLDTRHVAAAQMHSAAMQRVRDLLDAAEKWKQSATEAALAGERLLEKVATDGVEVTDDDLLAAAEKARREEALASIAEARVTAALRNKHMAQIEELRARRDILQADFDASITRLIDTGERVDELKAALDDAVSAYAIQTQAVAEAHRAATYHNSHELNFNHNHNPIVRDMLPAELPKVVVPQILGFDMPKVEMYQNLAAGSINARRDVIFALAPRLRQAFNRSEPTE